MHKMALMLKLVADSNTTLVKVKFYLQQLQVLIHYNSNTTLVKVKLLTPPFIYYDVLFKYNTC